MISSVFNPLNFATPVMQSLWHPKAPWDQPISGLTLEKWLVWKSSLPLLGEITVPRCYFSRLEHNGVTFQLHYFCDASESGYGTIPYLCLEDLDGFTECAFVTGKFRNAPIKSASIPRPELQGALLAVRIDSAVRRELEFSFAKVIFWTDLMIVLNYIRNERRCFQTYVANRVTEIRELNFPRQWRHCPDAINPADDASRGLRIEEFLRSECWLKAHALDQTLCFNGVPHGTTLFSK